MGLPSPKTFTYQVLIYSNLYMYLKVYFVLPLKNDKNILSLYKKMKEVGRDDTKYIVTNILLIVW